jgi:uncharacterized membrane protein YraQ (UPF0718 family)
MFDYIANLIVFDLLNFSYNTKLSASLHFFIMDITKIFFMLILVIYFMGLFRSFISAEAIKEYIQGKSKFIARIMAITLGAITPFCSCSSVPLFIGFVEAGIPLGITFSFLIASPMINEIAIFLLLGIVGWKITLLYVLAGLSVAFFGGMIMEKFHPEKWVESYVWEIKVGKITKIKTNNSFKIRHYSALAEVKEILRRIWKWVIIGIGIGAIFHGYFPQDLINNLSSNDNFLVVPMAVILGIPLYSNAVGVIPLAEAMLLKDVAIGTTLALMMSIAAISLPELLILQKVIKWQALALFTIILASSIIIIGWLFNLIL